jgi:integrase/recombinase XerD
MNEFPYQSPFKACIEGMIREKRSLGYKYVSSARTLYRFDQFCLTYGCDDALITQPLAHAWIQKAPNEALATLHNRACVLRQLALYMIRLGIPSYVLPKRALPKVPGYTPYIFSDQEIATLLHQADACHYCASYPGSIQNPQW